MLRRGLALLSIFGAAGCFNPESAEGGELGTTGSGTLGATSDARGSTESGREGSSSEGDDPGGSTFASSDEGPLSTSTVSIAESDGSTGAVPGADCPGGAPTRGVVDYDVGELATQEGTDLALGRIDGDEVLDFVVVSRNLGSARIFIGDGTGSFVPTDLVFDPSGFPGDVALGAVSDDAVDMFVAMDGPAQLWLYRGNGAGGFGEPQEYATPTNAIDLGDFDRNGVLDVAIMNGSGLATRLGIEVNETLDAQIDRAGPTGNRILVADLVGSDAVDIVAAGTPIGEIAILRGEGDGEFTAESSLVIGSNVSAFAVGDHDADGRPDLVVATSAGDLRLHYGRDDGSISATGNPLTEPSDIQTNLASVDVDADGVLDIVSSGGVTVDVRFGHGDRTFDEPATTSCAGPPQHLLVGDLNEDCVADVITLDPNGALCVLLSIRS